MNILVPCSLLAENILSVFRSPHLPLDTPRKAGFPFATRARKREPCPQRYVSRMIRTENFLSQIFFKVFLETTFVHVSWYPVHYQPKIFFWFFEVRTYPSIHLGRQASPLQHELGSGSRGALHSEVRIENDSDRKFSKSIFFQSFSGNHFSPRFMVPCSLLAENIFSVFRRPHSAPTPRYTILDLRLLPCNAISEGRLPFCNTSSEAGALPLDKQ